MKTRSDRADPRAHLAEWEYLVEPLEHELRQLRGVGFTIAAQTAMYHQRNSLGHERHLHQRILLEELTILRAPLQRATDYVNQMMYELEPHAPKRRKTTENPAGSSSAGNEHNAQKPAGDSNASASIGERAADGIQTVDEEDEWKGAERLVSKVDRSRTGGSVGIMYTGYLKANSRVSRKHVVTLVRSTTRLSNRTPNKRLLEVRPGCLVICRTSINACSRETREFLMR